MAIPSTSFIKSNRQGTFSSIMRFSDSVYFIVTEFDSIIYRDRCVVLSDREFSTDYVPVIYDYTHPSLFIWL